MVSPDYILLFLSKPFIVQCKYGNVEHAIKLIEDGCDVTVVDDMHVNGFIWACYNGHTELVVELLKYECMKSFISSSLSYVCQRGYVDIFDILIANGADPNFPTTYGDTPLMIAVLYNKLTIADKLLNLNVNVNHQNSTGQTVLFYCNSIDICHRLYIHGIDFNICDHSGNSALFWCFDDNPDVELIALFINYGAKINIRNNKGRTLLIKAVRKNLKDVIPILLNVGADLYIKDNENKTALDYDITEDILQLLQKTPLH